MTSLGKRLVQAAHEAVTIARGEANPSTYRAYVPEEVDVRAIRTQLGLTQDEFSRRFGFALSALRDWEQKRRQPDTAARAYLQVISREPEAVERGLGLPEGLMKASVKGLRRRPRKTASPAESSSSRMVRKRE